MTVPVPVPPEGGHTIIEHVAGMWTLCGWYMLGAALRAVFKWLGWLQDKHGHTRSFEMAEIGKGLILAFVLSFIVTQGLLWTWADWFGLAVPTFAVTALSAIAVGFFLQWVAGDRILAWVGPTTPKP